MRTVPTDLPGVLLVEPLVHRDSRGFFLEVVRPILEREFPEETAQTAFGLFGYGSEALKLDDELTRHWDQPVRTAALRWGI